jgi:hypothetical protein
MQPSPMSAALGISGTVAALAALIWTPPFVSIAIAIIAAVCWCIWLERHPSA